MMDKGDNHIFEGEVTDRQILRRIDHTQLKPFATWSDIEQLCALSLVCLLSLGSYWLLCL